MHLYNVFSVPVNRKWSCDGAGNHVAWCVVHICKNSTGILLIVLRTIQLSLCVHVLDLLFTVLALHGRTKTAKLLHERYMYGIRLADLIMTSPPVSALLLRCQYDPDIADSCGVTPLMDACRANHVEMAECLLSQYGVRTSLPSNSDI